MLDYIWRRYIRYIGVTGLFLLTACNGKPVQTIEAVASPTPSLLSPSPTVFIPTPTPVVLAAQVNGEAITLAEFQSELARYQAAVGTQLATQDEQRVLNDLVDELLLAQAAAENGFTASEADVQERYNQLADRLGGEQALIAWMDQNGYTPGEFSRRLARGIAAAWMRDWVADQVPDTAEQVHARQILLYNSEEAQSVITQLNAGADFDELALQYDPVAGGDLGWFPRGYLLDLGLEAAVFELQPGKYTSIIQTAAGYHIVQVLEIDPQYPLTPQAREALQSQALTDWLSNRRNQSDIQLWLP